MWYKVNFQKLGLLLLPSFLRQKLLVSFIQSMIYPLENIYYKWYLFREENLYKLKHNGQVCFLRKTLNDALDPELRQIFIEDSNTSRPKYIYTEGEQKATYLGSIYLNPEEEFEDNGIDFIVFVPFTVARDHIYELKAIIDFYKMAGKQYKIEQI